MKAKLIYLAKLVALFAVYFATARFDLDLDAVSSFATLVWPPTGIALAALLIFGFRLWPAKQPASLNPSLDFKNCPC